MTTTPSTPAAGEAVPFDIALAAIRRCARRLEKAGIDYEAIADAMFAEAAGRYTAVTDEAEAVHNLALAWGAIGTVAAFRRSVNAISHD